MKRLYREEFIQRVIYGAEKVIARGDMSVGEVMSMVRDFVDGYDKYGFGYLDEGFVLVGCGELREVVGDGD